MLGLVTSGALALAACKFPYPADVPDGDAHVADADVDGRSCTANTTTCTNGRLTSCGADGTIISYAVPNGGVDGAPVTVTLDEYPCPLGCDASGGRCADVAPANGLGAALDQATLSGPDVVLDDTSGDAGMTTSNAPQNGLAYIFQGGGQGREIAVPAVIVAQAGAPEILVLVVRSFTIKPGVRFRPIGTRALAIVAHLDIYVGGTLDASGAVWGPGGSPAPSCSVVAASGALGGGGNQDDGGASSTGVAGGMNLGAHSPALRPLEGGCASGQVAALGGGGAIQLVSRTRIAAGPGAVISVAGAGGKGRVVNGQLLVAGGGSGGGIRLEAPTIAVAQGGRLVGRGGGGAAGNGTDNTFANGVSGDTDLSAGGVPGATCSGCGIGGNGGTSTARPGSGQGSGTMLAGGGGAVGRCVLATRGGLATIAPGSLLIPAQNVQVGIR